MSVVSESGSGGPIITMSNFLGPTLEAERIENAAYKKRRAQAEINALHQKILHRLSYLKEGGRLGRETAEEIRKEALGGDSAQLEYYRLKAGNEGRLNGLPQFTGPELAAKNRASKKYREEIEERLAKYYAAKNAAEAEVKAAENAEKARAKAAANAARAMAGPLAPMSIVSKKILGGTRKKHRRMTRKKSRKAKKTI